MSVSSGSDVTIPIQDSPPPPPSPYGNRTERKTPEPQADVGIDNAAFEQTENDGNSIKVKKAGDGNKNKGQDLKAPHTQIPITNGQEPPLLTEALNSELINMNIMNTIPDKPQTEFGPYENPDEYFIAVNQHKKFLRRSEKLYVTKDKRKVNSWKKYICWLIGACILLSIVTIAVLAGLGLISHKTPSSFTDSVLGTTTSSGLISSSPFGRNDVMDTTSSAEGLLTSSSSSSMEFTSSSTTPPPPLTRPPLSDNHVPAAADITLTLDNAEYAAALNNKSSDMFRQLADQVEQEMRQGLTQELGLSTAYAKVMEFLPGSVVAKMRISWMDDRKELQEVQMFMAKLRQLGPYHIRPGATSFYALVNHCKFRNYGCSHFCTFDYEQLDFLCTCPELLRLAGDGKTCIQNLSSSTSSADILPIEDVSTSTEEQNHNEADIPLTEPPFTVQSISTEQSHDVISQITSSSTTTTSPTPVIIAAGANETVSVPSSLQPESTVEESSSSSSQEPSPVVETGLEQTTNDAVENGDVPELSMQANETELLPSERAGVSLMETTSKSTQEGFTQQQAEIHVSSQVEKNNTEEYVGATELPALSPSQGASEEESSIGAPLQRTESDNYSEVEQHQEISPPNNSTSTTAATPIVSFNTSRYSEERNILLSQQAAGSSASVEDEPVTEFSLEETAVSNSTTNISLTAAESQGLRHKSARLETYGEEPLSRQLNANITARGIISNSAEFMIYGDNVISPNPASTDAAVDSGLVHEHQSHRPVSGLEDVNSTEISEESVNNTEITSASVESLAGESGESSVVALDSASVQDLQSAEEKAGIVSSGVRTTATTVAPSSVEEYTTIPPFDLANDTLVNENATEDRTNAEPVILEPAGGEQEVSVETTPFTPEERPEEQSTNIPTPPTTSQEPIMSAANVSESPSARELEETPETTLPPIEETTIVLDEVETTAMPSDSTTNLTISIEEGSKEVPQNSSNSTSPAVVVVEDNVKSTTERPAGDISNNQLQSNPSEGTNSTSHSTNGDSAGSIADNENELS